MIRYIHQAYFYVGSAAVPLPVLRTTLSPGEGIRERIATGLRPSQ